jgi:predicted ribosome quality control (RQC) complex YloA/Tae2 family protein
LTLGIWNIIKGWLDPVVASKIHFTRSLSDLENFIPKSQIIKELGGSDDFEWKYIDPPEGENDIMKDTETRDKLFEERHEMENRFEKSTRQWVAGEDVGSERERIVDQLNENYWRLDPYIRARTVYDRMGMIGERGGFVYPKKG